MKKLITGIVVLVSMVQLTSAQKRNIISPGGVAFDLNVFDLLSATDAELTSALNLGYSVGYERLLGSRVSVGLRFTTYLKLNTSIDAWGNGSSYEPEHIPGYYFSSGTYSRKGFNVEYESRYYFREFDEEGPRSGYLGFTYQRASFTESFTDATYYGNSGGYISKRFPDQTFSANRFGLRFGYAGANAVSSNFFAGINFNVTGPQDKEWKSLSKMSPVTIYAGWIFGIPF